MQRLSRESVQHFSFHDWERPRLAHAAFAAVNRDEATKSSQPTIARMPGIGYFTRKP